MILNLLTPLEKDLGEFRIRRLLPRANQKMVGPWIFFDHMGPVTFAPGEGVNVRPHPHINLATVTYLFEGEILHRDSLGYVQPIAPGDINLMVAGSGITHSEREREELHNAPHSMHGLQLWHALPEADEEIAPEFFHYPSSSIPSVEVGGVPVRVLMGSAFGVTSPVKTFCDTLYGEAHLQAGQVLPLPQADELAVYVVEGSLQLGDAVVPKHHLAVVNPKNAAPCKAIDEARIAFIGGEAFPRRYIEWNFVSSRLERIEQAKQDWQAGRFPEIPSDNKEFIPLPE